MAASVLFSGCGKSSYTVGKDPSLDDILSVYAGGGGMEYTSQWSYLVYRDATGEWYRLDRVWWDDDRNVQRRETARITEYEFESVVKTLDGYRYRKYRPDKKVMDGYSESVKIEWPKSPGGYYRMDMEEGGMSELITAIKTVWSNYAYLFEEPVVLGRIRQFSLSDGPTDIYEGSTGFEVTDEDGTVTLRYKPMGMSWEEAAVTSAGADFMEKLRAVIGEDGANGWNGFRGDSMALDGSAFHLFVIDEDEQLIVASGHESYPDGFRTFFDHIEELFTEAFGGELWDPWKE